MSEQKIPNGARVKLKSGGPEMTVERFVELTVGWRYLCKWYHEKTNKFEEESFTEDSLIRID